MERLDGGSGVRGGEDLQQSPGMIVRKAVRRELADAGLEVMRKEWGWQMLKEDSAR